MVHDILTPTNSSFNREDFTRLKDYVEVLKKEKKSLEERLEKERTKLLTLGNNLKRSPLNIADKCLTDLCSYDCDLYFFNHPDVDGKISFQYKPKS